MPKLRLSHFSLRRRKHPRSAASPCSQSSQRSRFHLPKHPLTRIAAPISVFAFALVATALISHITSPEQDSSATIDPSTYYVSVSSSGNIDLSVSTLPDGAYQYASHTVTTKTNSPTGYKLYLSTASTDNNLNLGGTTGASSKLTATTGTVSSPAVLDTNSWGFAIAGGPSFSNHSSYSELDSTSTWAAVSPYSSPTMIVKLQFYHALCLN